jgi:hypothetical protein
MNKLYLWHRGELTIQVMQIVSEWLLFNANFFIVLTHWNNSPRVDMWHHSDTLSWFQANQSNVHSWLPPRFSNVYLYFFIYMHVFFQDLFLIVSTQ